ncbi:MAG TPA: DinB family protein [Candidatus Methylomirabilis sp.]|nr:DinB family protein [Candidatus Methylomirabilis sp.]
MAADTAPSRKDLLAALRASRDEVVTLVRRLSPEQLEEGRYENGWNGRQILAHLASIEWTYPRLIDIARTPPAPVRPESTGDPPTREMRGGNDAYNDRQVAKRSHLPVAELLAEFERNRAATIAAVESADDELFTRQIRSAGGVVGPLAAVFHQVAVMHVLGHARDIGPPAAQVESPPSVTLAMLHELYDYHWWANRRLWQVTAALSDASIRRDLGSHFSLPTLKGMLVHMFGVEANWLSRWTGEPSPRSITESDFADLQALRQAWDDVETRQHVFIGALRPENLHRQIEFTSTAFPRPDGRPYRLPLSALLLHVPNHATHHRSELATMLTIVSGSPPDTGMVSYQIRKTNQLD